MVDIDHFDRFIRTWGDQQGDRFLREISDLMLMNIRLSDLACRYAGDRFIILLPDSGPHGAEQIARQLKQAVQHLAFKPENTTQAVYQSVSISLCHSHPQLSAQALINELNQKMHQIKHQLQEPSRRAQLV